MPKRLKYSDVKKYVESCGCNLISKEYTNNQSKLVFSCKFCGNHYSTTYTIFRVNKKHQCKECGINILRNKFRKTTEEFKKEVYNIDSNFEVLGEYYNSKTKIEFRYTPTMKIVKMTPDDFLSGIRGYCISGLSQGELKIKTYLESKKVNFKTQFSFDDLRYKKKLRFDFAVFNENDKLEFLLEFDGEAHFSPTRFGGIDEVKAISNLEQQQIKDNLKNIYCRDNKILLIRIPYWHLEDLEKILDDIV